MQNLTPLCELTRDVIPQKNLVRIKSTSANPASELFPTRPSSSHDLSEDNQRSQGAEQGNNNSVTTLAEKSIFQSISQTNAPTQHSRWERSPVDYAPLYELESML